MKIRIEYSTDHTDEKIIRDLMKIETDVYEPEYRGEYEAINRRFQKLREMFVLAYDEKKLIGYLCFFPISDRLFHELMNKNFFHDDDIQPDDVMEWKETNHIYLLSIALYRNYHGKRIGVKMMQAFFDRIKVRQDEGKRTNDILASVVTKEGEGLAKKFGFTLIRDLTVTNKYKLFYSTFPTQITE